MLTRPLWSQVRPVASAFGLRSRPGRVGQRVGLRGCQAGIVGLTKASALETATSGIACNAICPGWVRTPLAQKQVDDKAAALGISTEEAIKVALGEKQPSMQFTTTEDIGELATFFCSKAANDVRGVAWAMDGGWTAQ